MSPALSRRPHGDLAGAIRAVAEVGRRGGADARLGRRIGLLPAADAFDPVGQVEQFAVGLVVEVRALAADCSPGSTTRAFPCRARG